ncbi:MAG: response regulator [Defluviitaleaceae bacterium]|nr:response regulator [Defluviitaleaceae bacterium]MCL2836028.1 response regulator [Defluviitaleaceae bacterium]
MGRKKPMRLLLIEDDTAVRVKYRELAESYNFRNKIQFVGMTDSSADGIRYVHNHAPEGIILDLELLRGVGSGMDFLSGISELEDPKPIIVVSTNTPSNMVHNLVRDKGVDLIFFKRQKGFKIEMIINLMLDLREANMGDDGTDDDDDDGIMTEYSDEMVPAKINKMNVQAKINTMINEELDLIGISVRYKGRGYLEKAINILVTKDLNRQGNGSRDSETVLNQVAQVTGVNYSSVIRAIQTAINKTWDGSDIEDLQQYYTARVDKRLGVPSPVEFIHYYADKIRKAI